MMIIKILINYIQFKGTLHVTAWKVSGQSEKRHYIQIIFRVLRYVDGDDDKIFICDEKDEYNHIMT